MSVTPRSGTSLSVRCEEGFLQQIGDYYLEEASCAGRWVVVGSIFFVFPSSPQVPNIPGLHLLVIIFMGLLAPFAGLILSLNCSFWFFFSHPSSHEAGVLSRDVRRTLGTGE